MTTLIFIAPQYHPQICGVGDYTARLAAALSQTHKFRVQVLHFEAGSGHWQLTGPQQQPATAMGASLYPAIMQAWAMQPQPTIICWQYTPGVFSSRNLPLRLPLMLWRIKMKGLRQTIFFHEVSVRATGGGPRQMGHALLQRLIANIMAGAAQSVATSIGLYQSYFWGKKPVRIPVGSNLEGLEPAVLQQPQANPMQYGCFANRFTPALAAALSRWQQQQPFQLVLMGKLGPQQLATLQRLVAGAGLEHCTQFTGSLSPEALAQAIASSHLFLQPQPLDSRGRGGVSAKNGTVMAAMQLGRPIITQQGDMTETEWFVHGHNCWLLPPPGTTSQWLEALQHLHHQPGLMQSLGTAATQTWKQHFTWPAIAAAYEQYLLKAESSG